ncbi:MAG: MFS transporter [Actinobacteria bacterium]|nr:MFS transporter [Actinomycetota bacterium]
MPNRRNHVFWIVTLQIAFTNFFMGGFGPAQPILRTEQHTSLTVAGLHGTALGVAAILSGFTGPKLAHRFGRAVTSWIGMIFFCVGAGLFVFLPPVQLTLAAILITGFGISTLINSSVTQLWDNNPEDASRAVSQSNAFGSIGYISGTLLIGTLVGVGINWRWGLLLVIPAGLILFFFSRKSLVVEHLPDEHGPQRGSLDRKFWVAWFGFIACISTEFATTFWSAALLRDRLASSASISTLCIVAIGTGMGLGRWYGPIVLKRMPVDSQLKNILVTQLIGIVILWLSHVLWISLIGLLLNGFGLSMQFALSSLRLMGFSEARPDLAIARSSLAAGTAIALAPLFLGMLGDHLGISRAYLMMPVLIVIALTTVVAVPSQVLPARTK